RIAHLLHRTLGIAAPLQREVSIRFETLLTRCLTLEVLAQFCRRQLGPLLGETVVRHLVEVVTGRATATARALDALRLQYPDHAEELERRFLLQSGFRLLSSRYRDLFEEGLIGGELLHDLEREHEATRLISARQAPLDLGLQTEELIGSFEMFAGLDQDE